MSTTVSKAITKSGVTFYTIYETVSTSTTSSDVTITVKSYIKTGTHHYQWGVGLKTYIDGSKVGTATGYWTDTSGHTICSGTYSKTISKTTSSQSITVKATSYSTTVNDYGGVGSSYTGTASTTVTVAALASYTISYNANGGSGAPSSQTKYYGKTLTLSSTKPTRTGYSFLGWSTSSSATSATYSAGGSYTSNSSATLYAVWKANTYTVSYNANGGSGAPSSQTKTYGVTLTLSSTKPTRSGYNFLGWGTSSSTTTVSYKAGASYTANAAITLYAVWEVAYIAPTITASTAYRCDSSGNADDEGTYCYASFTWKVDTTATSGNTVKSLKIVCGSVTGTNKGTTSGTSGTTYAIMGTFSTNSKYTVTMTVTDSTGGSTSATKYLQKEYYALYFSPKYHQAAFFGQDVRGAGDGYYTVQVNGRQMGEDLGDTGLTVKNASGLCCLYGIGSGGQNHGVHSRGYAPTADTYTSDSVWEIYRNSSGQITVGNSSHSLAIPGGVEGSLACTGSITASGHSTAIGSVLSASTTTSKSISAATATDAVSLSIPAGSWVIASSGELTISANHKVGISISSTSGSNSSIARVYTYGTTTAILHQCTRAITQSSTTTWYTVVYGSSAFTLTSMYMYAIRIS